jgi:hypothetical protein
VEKSIPQRATGAFHFLPPSIHDGAVGKPYRLRVQAMSVPVVRSGLGGIHLFGAGVA